MIASLGMYDRPETEAANDAFWTGIKNHLGYGPERLNRTSGDMEVWQSPQLVFSQTCGMPYRLGLHETVQLVGTPDYGINGTKPGYYFSAFVVRREDGDDVAAYKDRTLAYNEPASQSGWAAPQNYAQGLGFQFEKLFCSGGHVASAKALLDGRADIAALDAVTWRMICDYDDWGGKLKVIKTTIPTPGLPFITASGRDADGIFDAVECAIDGLGSGPRETLGLIGLVRIDPKIYLDVPTPAPPNH
jgi:hypothetical protein